MRMAVLALAAVSLLLIATTLASAEFSNWQYQREITIQENSGETLHDYQVLVELDGSDFPEEAQADGDDIRFTGVDGHELSYWIEEFDAGSGSAKIWVKVHEIPANGEEKIAMWYGNPGASLMGDGDKIFESFDNFEDDVWADKWIFYEESSKGIGTITEANSVLKWYLPSNYGHKTLFYKKSSDLKDSALHARVKIDDGWCEFGLRANEDDGRVRVSATLYPQWPNRIEIRSRKSNDNKGYVAINNNYPIAVSWHDITLTVIGNNYKYYIDNKLELTGTSTISTNGGIMIGHYSGNANTLEVDYIFLCKYASPKPTIILSPLVPATHTALSITKSPSPHSIRQFRETVITIAIENTGTIDATDIEITDAIHPSFDLTSGNPPNPKRYDLIRPGETRDLQYTISAKESGTFTLDSATVTYADEDGNIQEVSSGTVSIKVIPSTQGDTTGTSESDGSSTPGFVAVVAIIGLLLAYLRKRS
jgi:hypothetical protein